ncbi:hypothetical protein GpartN1_g3577.t1 [Galdieria partita]|uniref:poly(A)-specific ribonuclease n=1 Tax=Galdieria partita TaxID=83374 RepID=A0A9C7UQK9_9RHOD|nr:hypothetical protein GpartN1_g3577.t1 [Galdieria partita]
MEKTKESSHVIKEVWAENLEEELANISSRLDKYNFVAMDTEFPGVVARPIGSFRSNTDYHYQTLRCNVDLLKIIQLGLSFSDSEGNIPEGCACWQFNFRFSLNEDIYAQDSIDLLTRSGIDFDEHERHGIDVERFGELLISSGIVLNEDICWISFHSGYDFGYLLKILTCSEMPAEESEFFELLNTYFPRFYDMKYLMMASDRLYGGLNKLAEILEVERIGQMHQAGSDSLLTMKVFFKMKESIFSGHIDERRYCGVLYGLGSAAAFGHASHEAERRYNYTNNENGTNSNNNSSDLKRFVDSALAAS